MPRQMTMLSLQPEDLTRLNKLAQAAGLNRSAYIRLLLKVQEAKFESKEDELRIMSDKVKKESPSGNDEGGQGSEEARFLTNNLPKKYIYWEAYNCERETYYLYPIQKENWMDATWELKEGWWIGCNTQRHYLTRSEAAKMAVQIYQDELAAREELKRMGKL